MKATCPKCGFSADAPESMNGKTLLCPKCQEKFTCGGASPFIVVDEPHEAGASADKDGSENSVVSTSDGKTVPIERISTHRVSAIVALVIANWVFGLISLIYSCKTSDLLAKRRYAEAESASRSTLTWIHVSWIFLLAEVICVMCYLILWQKEAESYESLFQEPKTSIFSDYYNY